MEEQTTGTLAKRRFIFDLGVGGPAQDVIDRLEAADNYTELIVKAVRHLEEEEKRDTGTKDTADMA